MTVEYDLVVIGATPAGIAAAQTAARYHARVALIEQPSDSFPWSRLLSLLQQATRSPQPPNFAQITDRLALLCQHQAAIADLDALAILGIDVIRGSGALVRKPRLGLDIGDRILVARAYLVTLSVGAEHPDDWRWETMLEHLGALEQALHVGLVDTSPASLAIAQALVRLGKRVSVATPDWPMLGRPMLEGVGRDRLQARLEADGVEFITQLPDDVELTLPPLTDRPWNRRPLGPEGLNLGAARVRWQQQEIIVDRWGRASRPVYVCADAAGLPDEPTWEKRAIAATHHALNLPWEQEYRSVPMTQIPTQPTAIALGLTLTQAQQRHGTGIMTLQQSWNDPIQPDRSGVCRLLVRPNGTIVGAQVWADQAAEWVPMLSLMMQQRISLSAIGQVAFPNASQASVLSDLAADFRHQRRRSRLWRYGLEEFFAWRRYWG
jgi:choline dehydrogenase-like flavoprotein